MYESWKHVSESSMDSCWTAKYRLEYQTQIQEQRSTYTLTHTHSTHFLHTCTATHTVQTCTAAHTNSHSNFTLKQHESHRIKHTHTQRPRTCVKHAFAYTPCDMHSCWHPEYSQKLSNAHTHTHVRAHLTVSQHCLQLVSSESASRGTDRSRWRCHGCHRTASPRIHLWQLKHVRPVRAAQLQRLIITSSPAATVYTRPRLAVTLQGCQDWATNQWCR